MWFRAFREKASGSRFQRTLPGNTWFNTAAFKMPGDYQFGNESRLDTVAAETQWITGI